MRVCHLTSLLLDCSWQRVELSNGDGATERQNRTDTRALMSICRLGFAVKCQARCIMGRGLNVKKNIGCCSSESPRLGSIQLRHEMKNNPRSPTKNTVLILKPWNLVSDKKLHRSLIILQAPELWKLSEGWFYTWLSPKLLRKGWKLN